MFNFPFKNITKIKFHHFWNIELITLIFKPSITVTCTCADTLTFMLGTGEKTLIVTTFSLWLMLFHRAIIQFSDKSQDFTNAINMTAKMFKVKSHF